MTLSFPNSSRSYDTTRRAVRADRLGGDQVDDEIEFGRLLDRDVGRFRSAQNLVDEIAGAPVEAWEVRSIGYETSRFDPSRFGFNEGSRAASAKLLIRSWLAEVSDSPTI
jgi:hypothetical protein